MRILLTFGSLSWQKGSAAQIVSLVSLIRRLRPSAKVALLSHYTDLDQPQADKIGIEVKGYPRTHNTRPNRRSLELMWWRACALAGFSNLIAEAYRNADLVIDVSGDSYRDPPGGRSIAHNLNSLLCISEGLPFALASQSLGPFRSYNVPLTRFCLSRAQLIYVREARSLQLLQSIGIPSGKIILAPDVAFVLPATTPTESEQTLDRMGAPLARLPRPWIGISTSVLFMNRLGAQARARYLSSLTAVINLIRAGLGGTAFLIPHEIKPAVFGMDDIEASRILASASPDKSRLVVINQDLDPSQIKGIISLMDAFIGCRMHAAIAALSSAVPTIAVSWSHKYEGLMADAGVSEYVWNIHSTKVTLDTLLAQLWESRNSIIARLRQFNQSAAPRIEIAVSRLLQNPSAARC